MANGTLYIITDDEIIARFIVSKRWIRSDNSVKPEAFMPHPYPDLSVTRHLGLCESQLWAIGKDVVAPTGRTLHGRADVEVSVVRSQDLKVTSAPLPQNPNHANITGWPLGKPEQKIKALEIANESILFRNDT